MALFSPFPNGPFRLAAAAGLLALAAAAVPPKTPGALLWPLPIHEGCPSIFGESRANHIHGGVDFRTHREEGWPVYAPADGAIVRIRREVSGYGRAVYLRLDDGRTVVFGHLCRFASGGLGLEERLGRECAKAGSSFPGDIYFDPPVRVRAGQTVAYSGQLGIGSPHLHMEVRDGDDQLDPFLQGLPVPPGLGPPRILGLTFVPRDAASLVEGSFLPLRVKAVREAEGRYRLERPVAVSGSVDVALVADDSYGTGDIRCGLNAAEASVDGKEFFRADIQRFSLSQTFQGPSLWWADHGWDGAEAMLLRRDGAVTIQGVGGEGLPAVSGSGERTLRITARNRAGEAATVTAFLRQDGSPLPVRADLPGRGFRLEGHRFLPGGLLLDLRRQYAGGGTSLTLGGGALTGLLIREGKRDEISVLIPSASISEKGGALAAGGDDLGLSFIAGPSVLACGGIRLRVPDGARATAVEGKGGSPGAAFQVYPPALRSKAAVVFPKASARGTWVVGPGGRFMGTVGGEVPYKGDGSYALKVDKAPPSWGKPFPATVPHLDAREIRVPLRDAGSGPDPTTLRVRVDGEPAYPDWDGDAGVLRFDTSALAPGAHTVEGAASDRAGNRGSLPRTPFRTGSGK